MRGGGVGVEDSGGSGWMWRVVGVVWGGGRRATRGARTRLGWKRGPPVDWLRCCPSNARRKGRAMCFIFCLQGDDERCACTCACQRRGQKGGIYGGRTSWGAACAYCHTRACTHARTRVLLLPNCRLIESQTHKDWELWKPTPPPRDTETGMSCRSLAHIHLWPREGFWGHGDCSACSDALLQERVSFLPLIGSYYFTPVGVHVSRREVVDSTPDLAGVQRWGRSNAKQSRAKQVRVFARTHAHARPFVRVRCLNWRMEGEKRLNTQSSVQDAQDRCVRARCTELSWVIYAAARRANFSKALSETFN